MVDRLVWAELGDGRHHTGGIAGKEDDVKRMSGALLRLVVRDVRKRVSRARVLGHGVVVQVQPPGNGIEADVFQHRTKAPRALINLRLGLGRKTDHFGVAAIFKVEHAIVAPAMFVIANQMSSGVGGQRRLAGT